MPRKRKFQTDAERVNAYRNRKTASDLLRNGLQGQLVLELFPGAGLFGRAFEELGACVVRAPDILWGGDVREFRGLISKFDGIIGGPPCQIFSRAAIKGTKALNLIPEFVRLVEECRPRWAVMENVREARPAAPDWNYVFLRDWDCGGLTYRTRGFWFYGISAPEKPPGRPGEPEYSVLASSWNKRGSTMIRGQLHLTPDEAARLQGFPQLGRKIFVSQPGWQREDGTWNGVSQKSRHTLAVHMLGNGVPHAMGLYIARWVAFASAGKNDLWQPIFS